MALETNCQPIKGRVPKQRTFSFFDLEEKNKKQAGAEVAQAQLTNETKLQQPPVSLPPKLLPSITTSFGYA